MNEFELRLPEPQRQLIDDYLDAVDDALKASGYSRSTRRSVCDEVESQIFEMLQEQISGTVSSAQVSAVIAQLAEPGEFAESSVGESADRYSAVETQQPSTRLPSWLSAAIAMLTVWFVSVFAVASMTNNIFAGEDLLLFLVAILATGGLAATITAWPHLREIRSAERNSTLPIFGLLLTPAFLSVAAPSVMLEPVIENVLLVRSYHNAHSVASFVGSVGLALLLSMSTSLLLACLLSAGLGTRRTDGIPTRLTPDRPADRCYGQSLVSWLLQFAPQLCIVQIAGIALATFGAMIFIESIVASGPILSVTGALLAYCCYRYGLRSGVWLGASAGIVSLLAWAAIMVFEWGPREAHVPISCLAVIYAAVAIPTGCMLLAQLWSPRGATNQVRKPSLQMTF